MHSKGESLFIHVFPFLLEFFKDTGMLGFIQRNLRFVNQRSNDNKYDWQSKHDELEMQEVRCCNISCCSTTGHANPYSCQANDTTRDSTRQFVDQWTNAEADGLIAMAKLELTLGGIKDMDRLPQLAFIIDPNREEIAVKECRKLGIPIVAVTDTNCDPDVIDYIIPGNDDAIRAIKLFVTAMAEACLEGEAMRKDSKNKDAEEELKKAADAEAKAEEAPAVEAAAE